MHLDVRLFDHLGIRGHYHASDLPVKYAEINFGEDIFQDVLSGHHTYRDLNTSHLSGNQRKALQQVTSYKKLYVIA